MKMTLSPSNSSDDRSHATDTAPPAAIIVTSCDSGNSNTPSPTTSSTRNVKANQAATIAAIVESTIAHRHLIPGLAELLGGSKDRVIANNHMPYMKNAVVDNSAANVVVDVDENKTSPAEKSAVAAPAHHPSFPSADAVSDAANRFISDFPPFVAMSSKDSAPQIKLQSPPPIAGTTGTLASEYQSIVDVDKNANDDDLQTNDACHFQRKLVVKGGMQGYRMSRATHGVSSGCYYYEAIILESGGESACSISGSDKRGTKRHIQELESIEENQHRERKSDSASLGDEKSSTTTGMNGHLRIGWSTRLATLQAPVGYNQHSYAIRDILGSRIHNSHRQDKWGGVAFGPGDVLGVSIYLVNDKSPSSSTESNSTTTSTSTMPKSISCDNLNATNENESSGENSKSMHDNQLSATPLKSHIRFFLNGQPLGHDNGIGFDDIPPGTYHPAVSCYMEGSAWLNFGPHFVYPPLQRLHLSPEWNPRPISDLCHAPPMPEEVVRTVIFSGASGGGKKGGQMNLSKRGDESIISAFKDLVEIEAAARWRVHLKHLELHKVEIIAMRKERGLSTLDLV